MVVEGVTKMISNQRKNGIPNMKKIRGGLVYLFHQATSHKGDVLEIIWKTPKLRIRVERRPGHKGEWGKK